MKHKSEEALENKLQNIEQKEIRPVSGMVMLIVITVGVLVCIGVIIAGGFAIESGAAAAGVAMLVIGLLGVVAVPILYAGLRAVGPNEALVLTLFGNYYGTILRQGFYFVNPFASYNNPAYLKEAAAAKEAAAHGERGRKNLVTGMARVNAKKTVSLKNITLNNGIQKVNDVMGNPIIIGAVVIWKVVDQMCIRDRPAGGQDSGLLRLLPDGGGRHCAGLDADRDPRQRVYRGRHAHRRRFRRNGYRGGYERQDQDGAADDRRAAAPAGSCPVSGGTGPVCLRSGRPGVPVGVSDHDCVFRGRVHFEKQKRIFNVIWR